MVLNWDLEELLYLNVNKIVKLLLGYVNYQKTEIIGINKVQGYFETVFFTSNRLTFTVLSNYLPCQMLLVKFTKVFNLSNFLKLLPYVTEQKLIMKIYNISV